MKKSLLIGMSLLMALSLVGCKGAKKSAMNVSVFTIQQRQQPPEDNKVYKWIEEKFGVTFTWDILVGDKDQKIGMLIASGDVPDMVEVDSEKFQGAGLLIDIKPIVEKNCPNIMKHYKNVWKNIVDADTDDDGTEHVYSLPNYGVLDGADTGTYYNQNAFWVQKAVLKEFGFPKIKTVDEYFDLLEKYAQKYPTINGAKTVPFSIICYDWEAFNLWNPPAFLAGYPNDGNGHVENQNGKYVYVDNFTDANAKRWFKLANGYYQRGLIDPACFTENADQYYAKLAQGRVLGMFIQGWQFMGDKVENPLRSAGMYDRTYAPLPVVFDESIKPHYRDQTLPNLQRGYGFTVKCGEKKATEILKFLDQLLADENQKVLQWGFEGEDWQKDDQGRPSRTQAQRDQQKDNNWILKNKATLLQEEAPKKEGTYEDGLACNMDNLPWEYALTQQPIDLEIYDAYGVASYAALVDANPPLNAGWYPMWQCNPSPEKGGFEAEAAEAMTGFETVQRKYLPMMISGKPEDFDKTWEEYCNLLKPLTETYNKFMQTQLDHRVELFGGEK